MRMASAMSKRSYNSFSNAGYWSPRSIRQMMVGGLGGMGGWFLRNSNPNDQRISKCQGSSCEQKRPLQVHGSGCPMEGDKLHQQPMQNDRNTKICANIVLKCYVAINSLLNIYNIQYTTTKNRVVPVVTNSLYTNSTSKKNQACFSYCVRTLFNATPTISKINLFIEIVLPF